MTVVSCVFVIAPGRWFHLSWWRLSNKSEPVCREQNCSFCQDYQKNKHSLTFSGPQDDALVALLPSSFIVVIATRKRTDFIDSDKVIFVPFKNG